MRSAQSGGISSFLKRLNEFCRDIRDRTTQFGKFFVCPICGKACPFVKQYDQKYYETSSIQKVYEKSDKVIRSNRIQQEQDEEVRLQREKEYLQQEFYNSNEEKKQQTIQKQLQQNLRAEVERLKRIKKRQREEEKEREETKYKSMKQIQQQTEKVVKALQSCQNTVQVVLKNTSEKLKDIVNSLDQTKNSMTPEQKRIVEKTKAEFEKYPQVLNETQGPIDELKKGFDPNNAIEFLETVQRVEEKMGDLSTFIQRLEQSAQIVYGTKLFFEEGFFDTLFQQFEDGKQTIINKFEIRGNRYQALKQEVTKNGRINVNRLILKVSALSLSPAGKKIINELDEEWEDLNDNSNENIASFLSKLDSIVQEKYLRKENLDKMLSRLNLK